MAHSSKYLLLLADDIKLSLLERQRAISLNLEPTKNDQHLSRSLSQLQEGIERLEAEEADQEPFEAAQSETPKIRRQYEELYAQFHGQAPPSVTSHKPNNPELKQDFEAAQQRPSQPRRNKSVRFRDDPSAPEDPQDTANRAALFSEQDRYRDEPPISSQQEQGGLDNEQIHQYHKQVLRDQDDQLDTLGKSIGRQRMLGMQMGEELDDQNALLDDVESGVDRHQSTLDRARGRLGNIARKSKGNWSWITIGILICILLLLIIVLK